MQSRALLNRTAISVLLCFEMFQRIGGAQSSAVAFSYETPNSITLHEPVVATVTIENRSSHTVRIDLGDHHVGQFEFTLKSPDGHTTSARPQTKEGLSGGDVVSIEAGQRASESIVLNEWLRFAEPGTSQELRIRFLGNTTTVADDTRLFVTSLRVLPRDAAQLKSRCESLAAVVMQARRVADQNGALQQLAFVDDPIAVPYLRAAAEAGRNTF